MLTDLRRVEEAFDKKYKFKARREPLPPEGSLFASDPWTEERFGFGRLKTSLNEQKSRLNDYDLNEWQRHTQQTNPTRAVSNEMKSAIRPELYTIAWAKFYECASNYDVLPAECKRSKRLASLHLCEAPGAFVTSLNHFLKSKHSDIEWKWLASTLNPYYEGNCSSTMLTDDRFIKNSLSNWCFGSDFTGDLMNWQNSQHLIDEVTKNGPVWLITADGSVDCSMNPAEQESIVASLHFCEAITALQALSPGGTFIIKLFTAYESCSINLTYLLVKCFEEVNFFKPATSKPGNSEIYVICLRYAGRRSIEPYLDKFRSYYGSAQFCERAMFPKETLPCDFLADLYAASTIFFTYQHAVIDANIRSYERPPKGYFRKIRAVQRRMKEVFRSKYNLKSIPESERICSSDCYEEIDKSIGAVYPLKYGSFYERINFAKNAWSQRKQRIVEELKLFDPQFCTTRFDSDTLPKVELSPIRGKAIDKVRSSKFVNAHILKLFNELNENSGNIQDFTENMDQIQDFTHYHRVNRSENELILTFSPYSPHNFYELWQKSLMKFILKVISQLSPGLNLVFENFDILISQFGVGCLLLMAKIGFHYIILEDNFSIRLMNATSKDDLVNLFIQIVENIENPIDNTMDSVLGLVPLQTILSSEFSAVINKFNTAKYYRCVIDSLRLE